MPRVIYAWNYVEWGGAQIHFLALMKEARREFEVVAVLPKDSDRQFLGFLRTEGIRYELIETAADLSASRSIAEKFARRWRRFKSEDQVIKKIREIGTQNTVLHTDILPTQSLLSMIRLCRRIDVFITSHNALPKVARWRWQWMRSKFLAISLFRRLHVFCTNQHAADYFRRLYGKRVSSQILITYDSINPDEIEAARAADYDRAATLQRLGIDKKKFIVLAVGQFIDRKGRWVFLNAARLVCAQDQDIDFVWLTSSSPDDSETSRISSFGLNDRFHLIHSEDVGASRDDILRFFRVGDVYALPSFVEGLPISLLEAMAIGLPAISTNAYGIPEAVIHEKTGLLIEPGDAEALAASILRLRNEPGLGQRLAAEGREHVLRTFDERVAARTAIEEYKRAFDSRKSI